MRSKQIFQEKPPRIASSYEIDQQLQAELENGYSWEAPMVIQNPYQASPLTAVVIFDTKEECAVRFTVKGKTEAADISGEVEAAVIRSYTLHRQIIFLRGKIPLHASWLQC